MQGRYSVEHDARFQVFSVLFLEHQSSPGASTRHDSLLHRMVSNCVAMWFTLVSRASSSSSSRRHELLELLLDLEDHLPMGLELDNLPPGLLPSDTQNMRLRTRGCTR